jgi:catechol 2,3-dioxygenase-like lactoylglutathione lyase family enzyme
MSPVDLRLEVVIVPVADVERAKAFYTARAGFRVDHDAIGHNDIRIVQLTPPGSACSIVIGSAGLTKMAPGSVEGLQLVVSDMDAGLAELAGRGLEIADVTELGRPGGSTTFKFAHFEDPDGNRWVIQEVPA